MTGKPAGHHFNWRQLRDMKGSIDSALLTPSGFEMFAGLCGWTLARGHARSGHRVAIAAHLGGSDRFDRATADFAVADADQAEKDCEALLKEIKAGRIAVEGGI